VPDEDAENLQNTRIADKDDSPAQAAGAVQSPDTPDDDAGTKVASEKDKDKVVAGESRENDDIVPLPDFTGMLAEAASSSIELLNDVELNVKIELGRAELTVEEILKLTNGSVVELDKLAGDPVDILVNDQLVARGEVLVVNDNLCVRISEIIPSITERIAGA